jgi:MFS family permease
MIVLLHAYHLGFTAWQTAIMFTLYEVAGVVTNLLAGAMGARWGIKSTLLTGSPRDVSCVQLDVYTAGPFSPQAGVSG